jgi:hypothetical protein
LRPCEQPIQFAESRLRHRHSRLRLAEDANDREILVSFEPASKRPHEEENSQHSHRAQHQRREDAEGQKHPGDRRDGDGSDHGHAAAPSPFLVADSGLADPSELLDAAAPSEPLLESALAPSDFVSLLLVELAFAAASPAFRESVT